MILSTEIPLVSQWFFLHDGDARERNWRSYAPSCPKLLSTLRKDHGNFASRDWRIKKETSQQPSKRVFHKVVSAVTPSPLQSLCVCVVVVISVVCVATWISTGSGE